MGTISVSLPSDGTTADVSDYNTPINTIVTAINGNLDNANISGLSGTKITAGTLPGSALDSTLVGGWLNLNHTPDTVTYNGNRSYSLVFNSTDLTGSVSNGMRLRTTRSVTAPTQCTSLNGTNQYYSKSSPAGMTFTDDFVGSAWIKLSSYANGGIITRYNGTSGWEIYISSTGQVTMLGHNAAAGNFSQVQSYQSIPLNRWVHVATQLDMSSFTATPTTSYVMIDGVDVPAVVSRGGTNPTALVQAGNLELGSTNGGTNPFSGKIAQVAIFNAKVTQATMRSYMSQGYAGNETAMISAYSFNNSINDLNANANNLTANGSAVATSADSPYAQDDTGIPTGTIDFGIITSKVFSTNTTLTVQVPEGCTIPTSGGVSALSYSTQATPYGFPAMKRRWRLVSILATAQSTTSNATYGSFINNGWALTVPIGEWDVGWLCNTVNTTTTVVWFNISPTALTGLSQSAGLAVSRFGAPTVSPTSGTSVNYVHIKQPQSVAAAVPYIMYTMGATTAGTISGNDGTTEIFAECGYL